MLPGAVTPTGAPLPEPTLPGVALPGVALPGVALPGAMLSPGLVGPTAALVTPTAAAVRFEVAVLLTAQAATPPHLVPEIAAWKILLRNPSPAPSFLAWFCCGIQTLDGDNLTKVFKFCQ
jgi:hypothetical protein